MGEEFHQRHHRFILFGSIGYLAGVSGLMLRHNIWFSPDQFFIFALVAALFLGRGKKFVSDWSPIVLIFLGYEFFKGSLPLLANMPLHGADLANLERSVFGFIPTLALQGRFLKANAFSPIDYYFSLIYMSYFVFPLIFAYFLWLRHHGLFKFLTLAVFVSMYATFITVTILPAMPPWLAAEKGILPHVERVLYGTTAYLTVPGALPTFFGLFRANPVAAMPSMHAELPTLMFIFSLLTGRKLLIIVSAFYAISVFVAVVYLGEHYAVDAAAGILYAVAAFFLARYLGRRLRLLPAVIGQQ